MIRWGRDRHAPTKAIELSRTDNSYRDNQHPYASPSSPLRTYVLQIKDLDAYALSNNTDSAHSRRGFGFPSMWHKGVLDWSPRMGRTGCTRHDAGNEHWRVYVSTRAAVRWRMAISRWRKMVGDRQVPNTRKRY